MMTAVSCIRIGGALVLATALAGGRTFAQAQVTEPGSSLILTSTFLVPPDALVRLQPVPSSSPRWTFEGYSSDRLAAFLNSVELTDGARGEIGDPGKWLETETGVRIFPSHATIRSLTPETRAKIYSVLAETELNPFHHQPFLFGADVRHWFRDSMLPQEVIDDIDRLSYAKGRVRAFSDLPTILAAAPGGGRDGQLVSAIHGDPTWTISVRWPDEANWEHWLGYWTAGGLNLDHAPFLEALSRNRVVTGVDLLHLLPPNARKRLNSYPSLSAGIEGTFPDSFSTALRFFQTTTPDTAIDVDKAVVLLERGYDRVEPPYRFGDVLLYRVDGETRPRHADVHIFEDLVYTKLSRNLMSPWVIMKIGDVTPFFEPVDGQQLLTEGWRRRLPGS